MIGFAQMAALATGGMNLSVGSIGVCAVMTGGYLMQTLALPVPVAIVGALGLGAALGWLNGFVIARSGVSAFIITLASANLYSGAMLILTKAIPLNSLPTEVGAFGKMKIAGLVSPLLVIALAIGLLLFVFYRHSVLGRQILAAGANARAAKMSGVPVDRVITISHALSGLLAATAGMMVVAHLGAAMPAVGGEDWLLPSFLGPVLGGTPLSGGAVAVAGTMLGALLVTTIRSGLLVLQIGNYWLQLYLGVILLLAVLVDRVSRALSGASRNSPAMTLFRRLLLVEWSGLAVAILLGALALSVIAPNFLTEFNLYVMLRSLSVGLLVSFAQMVTLGVGQMNIAVGALGGLTAIIFGATMELYGFPLLLAIPVALGIGALGGLINGLLTARTGVNAFIITLATASAFTGINFGITGSIPFYKMPASLVAFGDRHLGAMPYLLVAPLIVALLLGVFFSRAPPGRRLLAFGGNPQAAELSGISGERVVVSAHVLSGLLAAAAAVLAVAQLGSAQPTIGADWLLLSFAAPIIGGAALTGGYISVLGTMFAVLLLGLIQNGMVLAKVDPYWVQFVLGALILASVGLNRWRAVNAGVA